MDGAMRGCGLYLLKRVKQGSNKRKQMKSGG